MSKAVRIKVLCAKATVNELTFSDWWISSVVR